MGLYRVGSPLSVSVDRENVTIPISAASLPMPTGAATFAMQNTQNSHLSSLDGKTVTVDTGNVSVVNFPSTQEVSSADVDSALASLEETVADRSSGEELLFQILQKLDEIHIAILDQGA